MSLPVPSPSERDLFRDLTRMLMEMRHASQSEVEAAIEARFRAFALSPAGVGTNTLQITLTWALPEGPDGYALQATEYKTLSTAQPTGTELPPARPTTSAEIIPFPSSRIH
jgi:hypothetical protein